MIWYFFAVALVVLAIVAEHYKTQIVAFFVAKRTAWNEYRANRIAQAQHRAANASTAAMNTYDQIRKARKSMDNVHTQVFKSIRTGETITRRRHTSGMEDILKRMKAKDKSDATKKTRTVLKEKIPKF